MCLKIKKGQEKLIAEEDLVCYKVVLTKDLPHAAIIEGLYYTFYQKSPIVLDRTFKSDLKVIHTSNIRRNTDIVENGLHSFKDLKSAEDFVNYILSYRYNYDEIKIIHCVIPKGSGYFEGLFSSDNNYISYASTDLTYIKKL